jgi:glycine cleavage system aminomethyltransferase T
MAGRRRDLCQLAPHGEEPAPAERRSSDPVQPDEADLARPKVKEADFRGKEKHLEYKAREHQPAMLCTLVMTDNVDAKGVARYPVGILPVMDPETGETLVDELGRRSYTTSIAYGPTIGKNIALAYLPWDYCQVGRKLTCRIFQRDLSGRSGGRRLHAAVRSGKPQAAELICRESEGVRARSAPTLRR